MVLAAVLFLVPLSSRKAEIILLKKERGPLAPRLCSVVPLQKVGCSLFSRDPGDQRGSASPWSMQCLCS